MPARGGLPRRYIARSMIRVLQGVESPELGNTRDLYVYLPPSYPRDDGHPVIYMQDGQNLFDPRLSFAGSWRVDRAAGRKGLEAVVVGIPNAGPARIDEYSPWRNAEAGGGGAGDRYLEFVTGTVKPLVDREFRTRPGPEHAGIAGSSMGGLVALYAFLRQPEDWGFAAALSPSIWFAEAALHDLVARSGPPHGRLYLDVGRREGETHVAALGRLEQRLTDRGYQKDRHLRCVIDRFGKHHESDWGRRFGRALPFLLRGA
jgi:predicted alpha/beta superfamily hydrolase